MSERRILVITETDGFHDILTTSVVDRLKTKKPDEFRDVKVERIAIRALAGSLDHAFLLFCDKSKLAAAAKALIQNNATVSLVAIVAPNSADEISDVFETGYLYTRGIVSKSVGDPEDLGVLARTIKDELRRFDRRSGPPPTKQVGWRLKLTDPSRRRLVSLFAEPVMRDFMQRLAFTVEAIRTPSMHEWRIEDEPGLSEVFFRLGDESKPNKSEAEPRAKKLLHRGDSTNRPKPRAILLEGETGVGKTVMTEWIVRCLFDREHRLWQRISTVNIGARVVEAELFGTISGAWTDAVSRPGKLLLSRGGLVLLDEIGDLPPETQAKLLVYLDDFEFVPDGWPFAWKIYCPLYIVAATNRNLREAVANGTFRRDLYHRFQHRLRVPALRERRGDLRPLIDVILQDPTVNTDGWIKEISLGAIARLEGYEFPGNFRELETLLGEAVFRARQAGRATLLEEDIHLGS